MKKFSCKTQILVATGGVSALQDLHSRRLFMVSDPYFAKNGVASRIADGSGAEQIQIYSDIEPDPTITQVAKATAVLKSFVPDTVVALGGGSALDSAKAMVYFSGLEVTFVAIPTTSGSGSEVTDFAILTHDGVKHPLVDERLRPDMAILDDDLLKELPPKLIADTGFDVISHGLEAYVATGAGDITDALAGQSFAIAFSCLASSYRGDRSVRLKMHTASLMAGMAFTEAGLGLCHAMSHTLGGMYHVPHGRLNAILLPAVIGINLQNATPQYARIARGAGISGAADGVAARNLKNALISLRKELDLPGTLAAAGVSPCEVGKQTEKIIASVLQDPCVQTNPVKVVPELVKKVLNEVTGHG